MGESVLLDHSVALRSLSRAGAAADEEDIGFDFGRWRLGFADDDIHLGFGVFENLIGASRVGVDGVQLVFGAVHFQDGIDGIVKSDESLLDRLQVVVGSTGSFGPLEQPLRHFHIGNVEVEDGFARADELLELGALLLLAGVTVDQKTWI